MSPEYMNKIYKTSADQNNAVTRNSSLKLFQPLRTKTLTQKCLSYLGPFIWNGLPDDAKLSNTRSSYQRCSVLKGVLRNFTKFTGKHLRQSLFFNKVAVSLLIKFCTA